jgi:aminopeptidase
LENGIQRAIDIAMHDARIDALARQLVRYSTSLKKGEKVLIDLHDVPDSIGLALIREVRAKGALPFIRIHQGRLTREMMKGAEDTQYEVLTKHLLAEMMDMDAYIAVRGGQNIAENSDVPAERMRLAMKHMRQVLDHRVKRTKWCVLRWPSASMAQQAGMSTEAFEKFYFDVCLLDYKALLPSMNALKKLMDKTESVHIKGPGTDLRFSIKGVNSIVCGGNYNIPDGEVFTAPVRDSVEGHISYNAPTIYQGIPFDSIRLEFSKGKIVKAEAGSKSKELNRILDSDEGARATFYSTRKSRGPSTSPPAKPTKRPTTVTARKSTGTWSTSSARTGAAAKSTSTASSSAKTAYSSPRRWRS